MARRGRSPASRGRWSWRIRCGGSRGIGERPHGDRDREGSSRHRRRRRGCGRAGAGTRHSSAPMIPIPSGVRVWIATGHTDMRRGMQGLALTVQEQLKRDPHVGDLYIFRGRRGDWPKILWHDGIGLSLYAKRLDRGKFIWPSASDGAVSISAAQMAYMLEGIDAMDGGDVMELVNRLRLGIARKCAFRSRLHLSCRTVNTRIPQRIGPRCRRAA